MIRAVVIDDEPMAREALLALIERYSPEVEIIGTAGDIEAAVNIIRKGRPELIFLDVQLMDGTGFDVLNRLDNDSYKIVFVTAFEEYAITAFKFSAMDYLLKPVNPDELVKAVGKVQDSLDRESMTRRLEVLFENISSQARENRKIALRTATSMHIVNLSEIIRCQSEKNYTQFFLNGGDVITVSKTLKEFEEMLSPFGFVRVHQSHLVNLDHVRRYDKSDGGSLILSDDSQVPVSMRKKDDLMKTIGHFRF
jgi:two-component system LytT family response regulator